HLSKRHRKYRLKYPEARAARVEKNVADRLAIRGIRLADLDADARLVRVGINRARRPVHGKSDDIIAGQSRYRPPVRQIAWNGLRVIPSATRKGRHEPPDQRQEDQPGSERLGLIFN